MSSFSEKFSELRLHLKQGVSSMRHTGFDPVYYIVFPAEDLLQAKLEIANLVPRLTLDGFDVRVLSLTTVLNNWFQGHKLRKIWQQGLRNEGNDRQLFQKNFAAQLESHKVISSAILAKLEELAELPRGVLLITDIEALHPFLHISGIEQQLTGKFAVPTVVFYPGTRGSSHSLRFLGFHRENGNYRSIHIG
jgi:hypothetical protein